MCTVPCFPPAGSVVQVFISRVNLLPSCGLVELLVDEVAKTFCDVTRQESLTPLRKFNESDGKAGDFCLVLINDSWHRARVVSIQRQTCTVFLVDQGLPHVATLEALAWARQEDFDGASKGQSCILANVLSVSVDWPESATNFLSSLPGKTFNGLVQHVLITGRMFLIDIPLISKSMCKFGVAKKMPADEFKCLLLKCLHLAKGDADGACLHEEILKDYKLPADEKYFYPDLLHGIFETVKVTEVIDPHNIYCKLAIFSKAVKTFSDEVHQHYEKNFDFVKLKPRCSGAPCASRGDDGKWQRARLKQNIEDSTSTVEILFVDEGKTEHVQSESIRPLHGKFMKMPVFTYRCSLDGVDDCGTGWTHDQTDCLKALLLNRTFVARLERHDVIKDVYSINLYAENAVCINHAYAEMIGQKGAPVLVPLQDELYVQHQTNLSVSQVGGLLHQTIQNEKNIIGTTDADSTGGISMFPGCDRLPYSSEFPYDNDSLNEGSEMDVEISCIESLQKFWCQMTKDADSLKYLMAELQDFYSSPHPQPIVESICVARNPENNKWYRAKIMTNNHNPAVEVRFIDYGKTQRVPVQDIRPLDPAFLRLNAQAFQCGLFLTENDASFVGLSHFQKFVDTAVAAKEKLKCIIKAKRCDKEGLSLNVVDIEAPFGSASKLLNQERSQAQVNPDKYFISAHDVVVGGKERVLVTCAESVNHFYCQLDRNSKLLEKVKQTIMKLVNQPQEAGETPGLNRVCLARYSDNVWYRGQVVETSPELKVQLVDYGDTFPVKKSDLRLVHASVCNSVPVLAIPLGLYGAPADTPQVVNKWFVDEAIGHNFTILVVAKGASGKLMVELFEESLNINERVQEAIAKVNHRTKRQSEKQVSNGSTHVQQKEEKQTKQEGQMEEPSLGVQVPDSTGMSARDDLKMHSPKHYVRDVSKTKGAENVIAKAQTQKYKNPNVHQNLMEGLKASVIVGPNYFWCQLTSGEDLANISALVQEAGTTGEDVENPETLRLGSPCLARYSSDNKWYRAQVISRTHDHAHVFSIDYGHESEVALKNLKAPPKALLELPPQALLCSLNEFDESKGFWNDDAADFFYLLKDKPLKVSICGVKEHLEKAVPQYAVEVECEGLDVNEIMREHWNTVAKKILSENSEETLHAEETMKSQDNVVKENMSWCQKPVVVENKTETAYVSCIVEPKFFWCQLADTERLTKISALAQEAGTAAREAVNPETLHPGSPCLARFSSDDQWYRAQILSRTDDKVQVIFIDYGNESEVDVKDLRSLPKHLMDSPPAAFLCSLNGFDESSGLWSDEAHDQFYSLLVDKPLSLTVCSEENNSELNLPQYSVEITCEGLDVKAEMNKYWNPAKEEWSETAQTISKQVNFKMYKEPAISDSKSETVYASCIVEPKFFWCQPENSDLAAVSTLLQEAGSVGQDVTNPETLHLGSPCLALFTSDNQWYRAQVIKRAEDKVQVVFIDYGNESEVDLKDVRLLPTSLLDLPPLAFLCSLRGFDESKGVWTDDATDVFYNLLVDKLLKVSIHEMQVNLETATPQYEVDVECEGESVDKVMGKYWINNSGPL